MAGSSAQADRSYGAGEVAQLSPWQIKAFEARWGRQPYSADDAMTATPYPTTKAGYETYVQELKSSGFYHAFGGGTSTTVDDPGTSTTADQSAPGGQLMDLIHQAGFRGQGANIMYAIVMAESGGNARAHNTNAGTGDNSYGLAQINMLGTMGPERLREYGLSSNNDLFDPLTNLKVAYKMSGGGTHFGDWSTYNSGAYRQFLGQTGATVTTSGGGGGSSGGGGSAAPMSAADFSMTDGLKNLFNTVPELSGLINKAVSGSWSQDKFANAVENTTWWKTHADTARSIIAQQANDPATYQQNMTSARESIQKLANQLGIPLGGGRLANIASYALLTGNDKNQQWLTDQLFYGRDWAHVNPADLRGGMAQTAQQINQLAADYGYQWTPAQVAAYSQQVLEGNTTIDTLKQNQLSWAKSAFPSLAKELDSGQTVKDLATPYVQSMSNLLEVDPGTLSIYTPAVRKALQGYVDPSTKQRAATPLWQFEDQIRQDPRWQYTQNAKDTVSTALVKLGADFGFGPQG